MYVTKATGNLIPKPSFPGLPHNLGMRPVNMEKDTYSRKTVFKVSH